MRSAFGTVRIAHIITRLNIGGPAVQAVEVNERLEAVGYHTLLVHGRVGIDEGDMRHLVPRGHAFDIAYLPTLQRQVNPFADASATASVFGLLKRFKPMIVHTHLSKCRRDRADGGDALQHGRILWRTHSSGTYV